MRFAVPLRDEQAEHTDLRLHDHRLVARRRSAGFGAVHPQPGDGEEAPAVVDEVAVPGEGPVRQFAERDGGDEEAGRAAPFGPPGGEPGVRLPVRGPAPLLRRDDDGTSR
ncbi:hypothetical protein AT728_37795 [Streptomyces silvensis]|uniref:Uncharacterized protein n=1 Tax=Streptomyces silvensis TaxID=1765722 RepID=A0A0W7WQY5_9ACTN|nr:hypothetical protein AT728_37795 [Streptomyces silvensis]